MKEIAVGALLFALMIPLETEPPTLDRSASGQSAPTITIEKLKVNGSGCRPNSTAVAMSPDNEAFTVTYSAYIAEAGGTTRPREGKKSCGITVRLNVPAGMTYAVSRTDHRGFADLAAGASAAHSASYRFQRIGAVGYSSRTFSGPFSDTWQTTDTIATGALVFAPCGKKTKLDIDTELRVSTAESGPDAPLSLIAMDATDGSFTSTYQLAWKSCA